MGPCGASLDFSNPLTSIPLENKELFLIMARPNKSTDPRSALHGAPGTAVLEPPPAAEHRGSHNYAQPAQQRGGGQSKDLARRYGITESTLATRRAFIRLGDT